MKEFLRSPFYSRMLAVLGILLLALLIFWAGTVVGYRKASFAYEWKDNYDRQFGSPRSPFFFGLADSDDAMSSHGAFGTVVGVRLPEFIVKSPSEAEKTITLNGSTVIKLFRNAGTTTDITPGETVVVIGEPDQQGGIEASLVRIVPAPRNASSTQ